MPAHLPVLLAEVLEGIGISAGSVVVDATCGAGGYTEAIAEAVGDSGTVIALDQDDAALQLTQTRLARFRHIRFVRANFRDLEEVLRSFAIESVDAICADLGLGSFQLDDPERGFSFRSEAEVDMRMDRRAPHTAAELLRRLPAAELGRILREYGEEPRWSAVVRAVLAHRAAGLPFTGTALRGLVHRAVGGARRRDVDAATQVFQALRIAVNDELGALAAFLAAAERAVRSGGRLAVVTYHSLEDRLVKQEWRAAAKGCTCPPDLPRCVCGQEPRLRVLTRKPIVPTEAEIERNPRARSAKLRVAEKK